jgi:acetyl-CoA carboxylase biotin carboxyl carrier protein
MPRRRAESARAEESATLPENDRERDQRKELDASAVQRVFKEMKDLVRSLEGTATTRVSVRAGGLEIEVERQHATPLAAGVAPGRTESVSADGVPLMPVLAPLVGVFYRASSPGAKPFVEVGDTVEPGQQIGIVEAMKVMNEITSAYRGVVTEILVANGESVQYEQRLMLIDTQGGRGE